MIKCKLQTCLHCQDSITCTDYILLYIFGKEKAFSVAVLFKSILKEEFRRKC